MNNDQILLRKSEIEWSDEYKKLCNEHARLIKYLQYAYQAYDCDKALGLINELGIEK